MPPALNPECSSHIEALLKIIFQSRTIFQKNSKLEIAANLNSSGPRPPGSPFCGMSEADNVGLS